MSRALLFGHDAAVKKWADDKFGRATASCHSAVGVIDGAGLLVGAVLFQDFNGSNVEITFYGPHTLSAGIVRGLAQYAFEGLKVNRITVRTPISNKIVTRSIRKLGFRHEGHLKAYYGPYKKHTAVIFGLLKTDAQRLLHVPVRLAQAA